MKTKLLIIALMLFGITQAQEVLSIGVYQDLRLAVSDDNHGNDSFTTDVLIRLKMQGNQEKYGYMIVYPEFELANLSGGKYKRYSANVGYVFNKWFKNFEYSGSLGFGMLQRWNASYLTWGLSGDIAYMLNKNVKLAVVGQGVKRRDLGHRYGCEHLKFSGFLGIEVNLL